MNEYTFQRKTYRTYGTTLIVFKRENTSTQAKFKC